MSGPPPEDEPAQEHEGGDSACWAHEFEELLFGADEEEPGGPPTG